MIEIRIPQENANDDVVMITWLTDKKNISKNEHIATFETSKSQIEYLSPCDGVLAFRCDVGDEVAVNSVFAVVSDTESFILAEPKAEQTTAEVVNNGKASKNFVASHNAQSIIDGGGSQLDPSDMPTWLVSGDIQPLTKYKSSENNNSFLSTEYSAISVELPHTVKRSSIRKRMEVSNLAKAHSAGFVSCLGFSVSGRRKWCDNLWFKDKISDLVSYESYHLLSNSFKDLNVCYLSDAELAVFDFVICGFSLDDSDSPGQLCVVPMEGESFSSIPATQGEIERLADLFFLKELTPEHFEPTTYTVTDLSGLGPNFVLPLINGNQCLIIAIASSLSGFNLFISFDHRVTEGLRISQLGSELCSRIQRHLDDESLSQSSCDFCGKTLVEEVEIGNRGLINIATPVGEKLICRVCFDGW